MLKLVHSRESNEPRPERVGDAAPTSGEHPSVTLHKVCSRPPPRGHVIVYANEKGGVGKSTLAFHSAIALCDAGASVAVLDLDPRQQSLSCGIENRQKTARCLQVDLPGPRHAVLQQHNGSQLSQEIARIGSNCDYIIIDLAGHDSRVARYAIALADTLVTPVNSSFVDLDLLGKFDPVRGTLSEIGNFALMVSALGEERERRGMRRTDWIVTKNRVRSAEKRQQMRIDGALRQLALSVGFRVCQGLNERVIYRELFPFGLTHFDLKRIPGLAKMQTRTQDEILQLVADLNLKPINRNGARSDNRPQAKVSRELAENFSASLQAYCRSPVTVAEAK